MADTRQKRFYGFTGSEPKHEIEAIVNTIVDAIVVQPRFEIPEDAAHDPVIGGSDAE